MLCLDFDGVIHGYASGWRGAAVVSDPPTPGALDFIEAASERFKIAIHSGRSRLPGGILAMQRWLTSELLASGRDRADVYRLLDRLEWWRDKPPAMVSLDDRALTFTGVWPSLKALEDFQPWHRQPQPDVSTH